MARFARMENETVVELLEFDGTLAQLQSRFHPSLVWVEVPGEAHEGMTYREGQFT